MPEKLSVATVLVLVVVVAIATTTLVTQLMIASPRWPGLADQTPPAT